MTYETITVGAEGPVGHITLERPDSLNAITSQMLHELIVATRWFDDLPEVRCVVLSGSGTSFSAGYDLAAFDSGPDGFVGRWINAGLGGEAADAIESMRAVSIAALHGWVIGGGVVLAAACDLRVAAADTRFRIPEVELGIALNWGGIPRLVREIGPAMTRELVMTCREFGPQEAQQLGFINRIAPSSSVDEEVAGLVEEIIIKPSGPVLMTKSQVNAVTTALAARIGHRMDADGFVAVLDSEEFAEAKARYVRGLEDRTGASDD